MKDDFLKYIEEEQLLAETSSEEERIKILYRRYMREHVKNFFDGLPLMILSVLFLGLLAISFGMLG